MINDTFDNDSTTSNNYKKENYIHINVGDFDINKVIFLGDRKNVGRYNIRYENDYTCFYIIPEKAFGSYGIKDKYKKNCKISLINNNDSEAQQVSIRLNLNNNYHKLFANIIDDLYKRLDNHFKKNNIKVHHPISEKYNTINLDINEKTHIYIYNNHTTTPVTLKHLISLNHIPFKIWPHIYIKNFSKSVTKNIETIYFNFYINVCVIEFENTYGPYDKMVFALSDDPRDEDNIKNEKFNIKEINRNIERF